MRSDPIRTQWSWTMISLRCSMVTLRGLFLYGAPSVNWKPPLSWKKRMSEAVTLLFLDALWSSLRLALPSLPPLLSLSLFLLLLSIHMFGSLCSHISSIRVRKWARPGVKMPLFISIDSVDKWSVFRYTMNGISKRMVIKWNSAHWSMKKEIREITSNDYLITELKQDVEHVTWIH